MHSKSINIQTELPIAGVFGGVIDDLLEQCLVDPKTGCWIWQRACDQKGYGFASVGNGKSRRAHIVSYHRVYGPVPAGYELDHLCRTLPCINPAHLQAVTDAVNTRRGNVAVLTMTKAREIRVLAETMTGPELADRFNVHHATIYRIIHHQTWREDDRNE